MSALRILAAAAALGQGLFAERPVDTGPLHAVGVARQGATRAPDRSSQP